MEQLEVLRTPFTEKLIIDNSKLEGFLDFFEKVDCLHMDCDQCGYCEKVAAKAITIDEEWRKEMIARFDRAVEILLNGELAGYNKTSGSKGQKVMDL